MAKVSESIFSGTSTIIPMADVQHIEKIYHDMDIPIGVKKGDILRYIVITKHTMWDVENDCWANAIYLMPEEAKSFMKEWCVYRYELEGGKDAFILPEDK
jgi:hypothetical protein